MKEMKRNNRHFKIYLLIITLLVFASLSSLILTEFPSNEGYKSDAIDNFESKSRSDLVSKSLNKFSSGSTKFIILGEPDEKIINLSIPSNANITKTKLSITGKIRNTINKYEVSSRPSYISGGDFDKDGNIDLIITDLNSQQFHVLAGSGDSYFHSKKSYETGDLPLKGTLRDFNNNGYLDFATANQGANTITVHQNSAKGDGTFEKRKDYKIGDLPRAITSGDFNNDGWVDIATVTSNDHKLWINLNKKTEDISFKEAKNQSIDRFPVGITSGDLNNDGYDDIAITHVGANITLNNIRFSNSVSVFINKGNDEFFSKDDFIVGKKPNGVILDDFNGDGWLDIATSNKASNDISVLLNKGFGKFKNSINYSIIERASAGKNLRAGDVDGDGDIDIVSLCIANNTIQLLRNKGDGTFEPFEEYFGGHSPEDIYLNDFDSDGDLDIAIANVNDGSVSIISNNGDGIFTTSEFYRVGGWPRGINHGDVDNDGDLDIITANYLGGSLTVSYNDGTGYFPIRFDRHIAVEPFAVVVEDFNKDGFLDLASADEGLFELVIILNDGDGNFVKREKFSYSLGGYPYQILYHDFNNDGKSDIVTSNNLQQSISILWNIGNETGDDFAPFMNLSYENQHPFGVAYGDVDGDGDDDLLCSNFGFESDPENFVSIIWNNGNSTFSSPTNYEVGINPINLMVSDLDLDGDLDIVAANRDSNSTSILMNIDNKTFGNRKDYPVGPMPMGMEIVDFNSDGYVDVIIGNHANDSISILYNKGNGTFKRHIEYPSGPQPTYLTVADYNFDGRLDIASSNKLSSTISVHLDFHKPGDIEIDIGNTGTHFIKHIGELGGKTKLSDFTEELNTYLDTHRSDITQTPSGPAIIVPISVKSDKVGIIEFSDLEIEFMAPEDSDFDGMPDDWELQYSFNPWDPNDAIEDPDSDNYTNLQEYLGFDGEPGGDDSTNPRDSSDFPKTDEKKKETDQICFIPGFNSGLTIISFVFIVMIIVITSNRKKPPNIPKIL